MRLDWTSGIPDRHRTHILYTHLNLMLLSTLTAIWSFSDNHVTSQNRACKTHKLIGKLISTRKTPFPNQEELQLSALTSAKFSRIRRAENVDMPESPLA